jgi:four helix bundle protein
MANAEAQAIGVKDKTMVAGTAAPGAAGAKYDMEQRLLDFTCRIMDVVESLMRTRAATHVGGQLLRSGTSPVGNHAEAQGAESRDDFIHKFRIVLKELRESRIWLILIKRRKMSKLPDLVEETLTECCELVAIFRSSVQTAELNRSPTKKTTL